MADANSITGRCPPIFVAGGRPVAFLKRRGPKPSGNAKTAAKRSADHRERQRAKFKALRDEVDFLRACLVIVICNRNM